MKTSELTGALLDYWVARAEGLDRTESLEIRIAQRSNEPILVVGGDTAYSPSTKWITGGPIIEREQISTYASVDDGKLMWWVAVDEKLSYGKGRRGVLGPTPLIAAMRAYVASKFGEEVPDTIEGSAAAEGATDGD